MSMTIWRPITGRARFPASGLYLSVLGLPVSGSFGSFRATMFPHRAPPQLTIVTFALLFSVSQCPRGSAASAHVASATQSLANPAAANTLTISVALPLELPSPGSDCLLATPALTTLHRGQSFVE